jgi:hypothetical protein
VGGGTHASESAGAGAGDSPDIQEQRGGPSRPVERDGHQRTFYLLSFSPVSRS